MRDYKIIAIDFDGTLCFSRWSDLGEPNLPLISKLKELQKAVHKLILWTCRYGDPLQRAIAWCRDEQDFIFDAVNDNLPEIIELYGSNSRKITCGYYIDDRALLPEMLKAQP